MAQQTWVSFGSYLASPKLSKQMREQAGPMYVFRQFTDKNSENIGKNKGDLAVFTKMLRIDTAGSTLVETATMPNNRIKFVQGTCTLTEYGNGVNYTQKIESLSEFNVRSNNEKMLIEDQKETLDAAVATQFKLAKFKAVASSTATTVFTINGTATATATANISDANVRDIVAYMKSKKIPKFGGGYYSAILSINSMRGVYDFLQAVAQYADAQFRFTDEVGRYYGTRMIEDNAVLSNIIGSGTNKGEAIFFGADAVTEAVALPEELRYEETDVGRSKKLAWYAILGFKKTWDLAADDSNSTGVGIERIVHVTSA